MLVARLDELGKLAAARVDAASQLVAGCVSRCLPALENRTGPVGAGVLDDVSNCSGRFKRTDGVGVNLRTLRSPPRPSPLPKGRGRASPAPVQFAIWKKRTLFFNQRPKGLMS